jgi:hypothetical protein
LREQARGDRQIAFGAAAGGIEAARHERDAHCTRVLVPGYNGPPIRQRNSCSRPAHVVFLRGGMEER